ncbi:MAG: hypothetical protein CM15mP21_8300 [Hyphomicrobiales bacterium]|nr:MAG: hypothetical protein CM15mP21_8300 [Hyphomicrobiales bacterium]
MARTPFQDFHADRFGAPLWVPRAIANLRRRGKVSAVMEMERVKIPFFLKIWHVSTVGAHAAKSVGKNAKRVALKNKLPIVWSTSSSQGERHGEDHLCRA